MLMCESILGLSYWNFTKGTLLVQIGECPYPMMHWGREPPTPAPTLGLAGMSPPSIGKNPEER